MARADAQFKLRLPLEVKERIAQSAFANRRSMNAEIVFQLEKALAVLGPREDDDGAEVPITAPSSSANPAGVGAPVSPHIRQ